MRDLGKWSVGVGMLLLLGGAVFALLATTHTFGWPQDPGVGLMLAVVGFAVLGLVLRPLRSEARVGEDRTPSALGRPEIDVDGLATFQALVGPPTSLKVETPAGHFILVYRDVTVVGAGGSVAGSFTCTDQADFDRKAKDAGWARLDSKVALDGPIPVKRASLL